MRVLNTVIRTVVYIYYTRCITYQFLMNLSMPQVQESQLPKECAENVSAFTCLLRAFGFLAAIISVRSGASLWGIIEYVPSLQWICGSLLSLHTFFGSNLAYPCNLSLTNPSTGTCPVSTCLALQRMNPAPRNGLERLLCYIVV